MNLKLASLIALLALTPALAPRHTAAQERPYQAATDRDDQSDPFFSKAKIKAEIELAERANNKLKGDAAHLAEITSQLRDAAANNTITGEENVRRLGEVEKLAKAIREKAGGRSDEAQLDQPPRTLQDGIGLLSDLVKDLSKEAEKSSRFTTSAALIDRSNRIVSLVHYLRKNFYNR